jgi:hypothetical protein
MAFFAQFCTFSKKAVPGAAYRTVVGRAFGWLERYRRLWKNCERKLHNTLQMTVLAFMSLLLKRY